MRNTIKILSAVNITLLVISMVLLVFNPTIISSILICAVSILLLIQLVLDYFHSEKEKEFYFAKTNPKAIIPTKRDEDGCYDLYACIDDEVTIPPHTNKLIPTGIASAFNPKYRIAFRERGSNTKYNGIVMAGQIDSGYRNEYFVSIYNGNDIPLVISNGIPSVTNFGDCIGVPTNKAICQFAIEEVPEIKIVEKDYDYIKGIDSERGMGKLGSSNK